MQSYWPGRAAAPNSFEINCKSIVIGIKLKCIGNCLTSVEDFLTSLLIWMLVEQTVLTQLTDQPIRLCLLRTKTSAGVDRLWLSRFEHFILKARGLSPSSTYRVDGIPCCTAHYHARSTGSLWFQVSGPCFHVHGLQKPRMHFTSTTLHP